MAKNAGKIDIEMHKGTSNLTSFGGLCSVIELFFKMGLDKSIDALIGARNERGAKDSEHVLSLVLLNLGGGTAVDNLNFLREKLAFEKIGIRIPSPSAGREWLKSFHNPSEDSKRGMGQAFIPEENKYLSGWRDVFAKSFHFAWKLNPRAFLTLDIASLRRRCEDGRHGDRDGSGGCSVQLQGEQRILGLHNLLRGTWSDRLDEILRRERASGVEAA
ncbi:MAG TPA: hypothetical protein PLD93_06355 [Synergistaceae bacterium]|nr:hypothetical protein [Synergistaceae bacterium]